MPGAATVMRDMEIYVDATGTAQALNAEDDGSGFGEAAGREFPTAVPLWSPGRRSVRQDAARPAGIRRVASWFACTSMTGGQDVGS